MKAQVKVFDAGADGSPPWWGALGGIGVPGAVGFGVGICPALPTDMTALSGYNDKASPNYGNYLCADGSVMVWIPAFLYKWGNGTNGQAVNELQIKPFEAFTDLAAANAAGFAVHRAFYDGGLRGGFFVDKYMGSNIGGVLSSKPNQVPCDTDGNFSSMSAITGVVATTQDKIQEAAKSRGEIYHATTVFIHAALAFLAYAHGQASSSTAACAWYQPPGSGANYPKGSDNNALGCSFDAELVWESAGDASYPGRHKTGSANKLDRTTHNGQLCGVTDLSGSMGNCCFGFTFHEVYLGAGDGKLYALKTSVRMRDLVPGVVGNNAFFGEGIDNNYDDIGIPAGGGGLGPYDGGFLGSLSPMFSTDTSGAAWQAAGIGLPLVLEPTPPTLDLIGQSTLYAGLSYESMSGFGIGYGGGLGSGVWSQIHLAGRNDASGGIVGCRAARYL